MVLQKINFQLNCEIYIFFMENNNKNSYRNIRENVGVCFGKNDRRKLVHNCIMVQVPLSIFDLKPKFGILKIPLFYNYIK